MFEHEEDGRKEPGDGVVQRADGLVDRPGRLDIPAGVRRRPARGGSEQRVVDASGPQ